MSMLKATPLQEMKLVAETCAIGGSYILISASLIAFNKYLMHRGCDVSIPSNIELPGSILDLSREAFDGQNTSRHNRPSQEC